MENSSHKKEYGTNLKSQTFHNLFQAPAQGHAPSHMLHVLYHETRIVLDIHGLCLVHGLCLYIDPFLYNTYHEDRHEGSLSNEAMNEHCAVYYVLNEAVIEENKKKKNEIQFFCFQASGVAKIF